MGLFDFFRKRSPERDLRAAARAYAAARTPAVLERMKAALRDARFFMPVPDQIDPEPLEDGHVAVGLFTVAHPETGKRMLVAFTREDALRNFAPRGCRSVPVTGEMLRKLVLLNRQASLLVQGTDWRMELSASDFLAMAEGTPVGPDGTRELPPTAIRVCEPQNPPSEEFVSRLRQCLAANEEVTHAYIAEGAVRQGDVHLMVGVRLEEPGHQLLAQPRLRIAIHLVDQRFLVLEVPI